METPAQRRLMADTEHSVASSVVQTIYKSPNMSGRQQDEDTSANILSRVAFDRKKKSNCSRCWFFIIIIIFI